MTVLLIERDYRTTISHDDLVWNHKPCTTLTVSQIPMWKIPIKTVRLFRLNPWLQLKDPGIEPKLAVPRAKRLSQFAPRNILYENQCDAACNDSGLEVREDDLCDVVWSCTRARITTI